MESPRRDMVQALRALALVVLPTLRWPWRTPPGQKGRRQRKTRICRTHGKVVPNRHGRCPSCKGELTDK